MVAGQTVGGYDGVVDRSSWCRRFLATPARAVPEFELAKAVAALVLRAAAQSHAREWGQVGSRREPPISRQTRKRSG